MKRGSEDRHSKANMTTPKKVDSDAMMSIFDLTLDFLFSTS